MSRHLRENSGDEVAKATYLELFFDLVYVFAVSQLAARLVHHLTWENAAQVGFLLAVVWWAWIYTTWMTSWFHPDATPVRIVLLVVLVISQFMSAAIGTGFEENAGLFAGSYVALQVVRNLFNVVFIDRPHPLARPFDRILAWSIATAPLWIAGIMLDGAARWVAWGVALLLDVLAPSHGYTVPGLGRSSTSEWSIQGGHFAERFQLFVIIALGESIVVTGATAASVGLTAGVVTALGVAIAVTAMMWWLYFDAVAKHSEHAMAHAADPGRMARNAFTYAHLPIVAGIIVTAVGSEFVVAHPDYHLEAAQALALAAGPAIYLIGHDLFRLQMIRSVSVRRLVAAAVLLASAPLMTHVAAVWAAVAVLAVLVALVASEARWPSFDREAPAPS